MRESVRVAAVVVALAGVAGIDLGVEWLTAEPITCGSVLVPPSDNAAARFGSAVALDADHIYVGASGAGRFAPSAGAVFAFTHEGRLVWRFDAPADHVAANLGGALALSGGILAVSGEHERQGPALPSVFFLDADTGAELHRLVLDAPSQVNLTFVAADGSDPGRFAVSYGHQVYLVEPAAKRVVATVSVSTDAPVAEPPMRGHETQSILGVALDGDRLVTLRRLGGTSPEVGRLAVLESFDVTTGSRSGARTMGLVEFFPFPAEIVLRQGLLYAVDRSEQAVRVLDPDDLSTVHLVALDEPHGTTGVRGLALGDRLLVTATGGAELEELGQGRGVSQIILLPLEGNTLGDQDDRIVTDRPSSGFGWAHTFAVDGPTVAVGAPSSRDGYVGYVRLLEHRGPVSDTRLTCPGGLGAVGECEPSDDFDADGLGRAAEASAGTDPCRRDTDRDGLLDSIELHRGLDPLSRDTDGDGLGDGIEFEQFWTDPARADTDGDGRSDGDEAAAGTDPRDPNDPPRGLLDSVGPLDDGATFDGSTT